MSAAVSSAAIIDELRYAESSVDLADYRTMTRSVPPNGGSSAFFAPGQDVYFTVPSASYGVLQGKTMCLSGALSVTLSAADANSNLYFRSEGIEGAIYRLQTIVNGTPIDDLLYPGVATTVFGTASQSTAYGNTGTLRSSDPKADIGVSLATANGLLVTGTSGIIPFSIPLHNVLSNARDYIPCLSGLGIRLTVGQIDDVFVFATGGSITALASASTPYVASISLTNLKLNYSETTLGPDMYNQIVQSQAVASGGVLSIKSTRLRYVPAATTLSAATSGPVSVQVNLSSMSAKMVAIGFCPTSGFTGGLASRVSSSLNPNLTNIALQVNGMNYPAVPLQPSLDQRAYTETMRALNRLYSTEAGHINWESYMHADKVTTSATAVYYSIGTQTTAGANRFWIIFDLEKVHAGLHDRADNQDAHSGIPVDPANCVLQLTIGTSLANSYNIFSVLVEDSVLSADFNNNTFTVF